MNVEHIARIRAEACAIGDAKVREEVLKVIDTATDNGVECIATPPEEGERRSLGDDWEAAFYLTLEHLADDCSPAALQWLRSQFGQIG